MESFGSSAIAARGLGKQFGERTVVADVTFEVARGGAFGLLGPNGAGKTTIIRLLNGLLAPSAGTVYLFDDELTPASADRLRARIGVQTDTALYDTMSVAENLTTWGELFGMRDSDIRRRIPEVLDLLGLADRAGSRVGELSKGMRQKAAIARAVLHEPELLFLDEPTAGLDPTSAADLIDYLRGLIAAGATTVVLTTHQLHGLEALCDRVGILDRGRLVAAGEVAQLLDERWPAERVRLRLTEGRGDADAVLAGFGTVATEGDDIELTLRDGAAVPDVVAALVAARVSVAAVVPVARTIEDLYFSVIADTASEGEK